MTDNRAKPIASQVVSTTARKMDYRSSTLKMAFGREAGSECASFVVDFARRAWETSWAAHRLPSLTRAINDLDCRLLQRGRPQLKIARAVPERLCWTPGSTPWA